MREKQMRDACSSVLLFSLLYLLLLAHALPTLSAQGGEWIKRASPPTPGYGGWGEAVVGTGDYVYILRCYSTGRCQFWRYNATSDGWVTLQDWIPDNPIPRPKSGTALAWDRGQYLYALLGADYEDKGGAARYYFYRYDLSSNVWVRLSDTTHAQGAGDAIAWSGYDNMIYAILGSVEHGTVFARFSPTSNAWETLPFSPSWSGTDDGASLVWTGGADLCALRGEWDETLPNKEFARYDIPSRTWENMAPIPASHGVDDGGSLLWVGGWISDYSDYVFALAGGLGYDPNNPGQEPPGYDFYRYSISRSSWTTLEQIPYGIGGYVGNRLGFAGEHIYYWQGAPSTWEGGGNAFYMFNFQATTTTTQQQTTTTVTTSQTTTSSATTQTSVTTTSQITSTTIVLTTTSSYVTQTSVTTRATAHTTEQLIATPGAGLAFAVIGIGAGVAALGAGVAFAASGQPGSRVFAYGGYYYCRKHGVPVLLVNGRLWCPVEGNYLRS